MTKAPTTTSEALQIRLRPDLFRALGDPTRLLLVARLAHDSEPRTVTELSDCCGVHLSGVSRHLTMLRDAGVVVAEKRGREVRYRLDSGALTGALRGLAEAIEACRAACCDATRVERGARRAKPRKRAKR